MNIEELEDKHYVLSKDELNHRTTYSNTHTKLSVEFAIEVLGNMDLSDAFINCTCNDVIVNKIQELKKYLDENI